MDIPIPMGTLIYITTSYVENHSLGAPPPGRFITPHELIIVNHKLGASSPRGCIIQSELNPYFKALRGQM